MISIFEDPRGCQLLFFPDTLTTYRKNNFSALLKKDFLSLQPE